MWEKFNPKNTAFSHILKCWLGYAQNSRVGINEIHVIE